MMLRRTITALFLVMPLGWKMRVGKTHLRRLWNL
ncbi:hypothetical protein E2C01_044808 [Portunus trituberculatus]|uniref:Uncharacterized protein n=1 Tax=Portunus trituberculatus TaxID=210409 RepID=A0A5B7G155_PORTR|nr:hypothetical protein [Portunus trituberculatus]